LGRNRSHEALSSAFGCRFVASALGVEVALKNQWMLAGEPSAKGFQASEIAPYRRAIALIDLMAPASRTGLPRTVLLDRQ
jgi:hypothetical protein